MPRKIINVVGAAIIKDGEVLCARRGEGKSLAGYWEFPGGKIELHESARQALHREIEEELLCEVEIGTEVCTTSYDYDFGTVVLTTFICHLLNGAPRLTEHQEIRWLNPQDMPTLVGSRRPRCRSTLSIMDLRKPVFLQPNRPSRESTGFHNALRYDKHVNCIRDKEVHLHGRFLSGRHSHIGFC